MSRRYLRSLAKAAVGRSEPEPTAPAPPPSAPVIGIVEEFSRRLVRGWVVVGPQAPATRVDLFVDDLLLASTYATPDAAMSGSDSVLRGGQPSDGDGQDAVPLVHAWQAPPVPGPADDRRNSGRQIRTFSFRVRGVWKFLNKRSTVSLQVGEHRLPINGHGMFLTPPKRGQHSMAELRELMRTGHVLSQDGRIQLSKTLDTQWQSQVMELYERLRAVFAEEFGHDLFFIYGTLLGAVREGGFIGHDIDFDAAYVSDERSGPAAGRELAAVALRLIELGYEVEIHTTALHVTDPSRPGDRVDVFHTWFDTGGVLRFPWGVAGTSVVTEAEWSGTREIDFPPGRGLVPVQAEAVVECLYGADWRRPKPGFSWVLARTDAAVEGEVPEPERTKVYWANFYAHHSYTSGSPFFEFVEGRRDTPGTVVDLGCGDGRDALAFGAAGRRVLGLDQSPVGIDHAAARAVKGHLEETVRFRECDVADTAALGDALDDVVNPSADPVLYYLRFFLHAIDENTQRGLLDAIGAHARPGDGFAAEFRSDKDEATTKVHEGHYRRYQNAEVFLDDLRARGWEVTHQEEGTGLSPYGEEDPVLCRVIAHRPTS